jgi:hypothetical protein
MKYKYYLKKTIKLFRADDIIFHRKKKMKQRYIFLKKEHDEHMHAHMYA